MPPRGERLDLGALTPDPRPPDPLRPDPRPPITARPEPSIRAPTGGAPSAGKDHMTPEIMTYYDATRKIVFRLIQGGPDPLYRRTCYELRRRRWRRVRRDRELESYGADTEDILDRELTIREEVM